MAGLKQFFDVSHRQSVGHFTAWGTPAITCWDDHAILNIDGKAYDVTHCNLDELGDRGIQWDNKKEVFFQLILDDGRKLVGYMSNLKGFRTFMKQWRLMKRNLAAEARENAKAQKEAARAEKEAAKKVATKASQKQNATVELAKALKALKELHEAGIISESEYETKRQALVDEL